MNHELVLFQINRGNVPQFQYEASCLCGFTCRTSNEEALKSQFISHARLDKNSYEFPKLERFPVEEEIAGITDAQIEENPELKVKAEEKVVDAPTTPTPEVTNTSTKRTFGGTSWTPPWKK